MASQADRLFRLLQAGGWWTTQELLREVPCIVHSRISDLRARGLTVEHETTGSGAAGSRYRLTDLVVGGTSGHPRPDLKIAGPPGSSRTRPDVPPTPGQLQLEVA